MIYLKRFTMFAGIIGAILLFMVINTFIIQNLNGNTYLVVGYLTIFVGLVAFTDVQIDKWLERRRKRSQAEFEAELDRFEELQEKLRELRENK